MFTRSLKVYMPDKLSELRRIGREIRAIPGARR
jgi:hypothetical protein